MLPLRGIRGAVLLAVVMLLGASAAHAWGPHPAIAKAALDVLPDAGRWKAALGEANFNALIHYSWMPDQQGQDLGAFYADDYLLIRAMPRYAAHGMPAVQEAYAPFFRRALQALRTETPTNACRQMGPLIHFVEDSGAPPHAKPNCPHHGELENWVDANQIAIPGYKPQLLGKTDDEALQGMVRRLAGLVAFSIVRADRALPLVSAPEPDRAKVEPILLESALESARVLSDVFLTVFTLGLAQQPEGAGLQGTVTAPAFPQRNDHGARVLLLNTDYATLAVAAPGDPGAAGWQGAYAFHHLPPGTYRVLVYRTAAEYVLSEPISLIRGRTAKLDFALPSCEPAGNILENPDARLYYLEAGQPDRWRRLRFGGTWTWVGAGARVTPRKTYRCGAVLKDPTARVKFQFSLQLLKKDMLPATIELATGQTNPPEVRYTADLLRWSVTPLVETDKPLSEAIERVWVVPE